MAKVIQIQDNVVFIGLDNGMMEEVKLNEMSFTPQVGDEVDVFKSDTKTVIYPKAYASIQPNNSTANTQVISNESTATNVVNKKDGKEVDKLIYCILAFCLGGFGVHKFYIGKIGVGIASLLFFWTGIPSIIALIDFIKGITKQADENGKIIV